MYTIDQHTSLPQAAGEQEYRALLETVQDATLFNDWPWLSVSSKHSQARNHLFLTARTADNNQLVAFIGLAITKEHIHRLPVTTARFLQYPYGDRIAMVIHPGHHDAWEELLQVLTRKETRRWDLMIWDECFDTTGLIARAEQWALLHGKPILIKKTCSCPAVATQGISREELAAPVRKKRKINIRRCRKKLATMPHSIVHRIVAPQEVDGLLEELAAIERISWKGSSNIGIFSNPACHDFFVELSRNLAQDNVLLTSLIHIDGRLVSYRYGFLYRNTLLDYNIGYLPEYRPLGIGTILLEELLWESIARNYTSFDASRVGADSINPIYDWATHSIDHYRVYWFSNTLMGKLCQFLFAVAKPLARKWTKEKTTGDQTSQEQS